MVTVLQIQGHQDAARLQGFVGPHAQVRPEAWPEADNLGFVAETVTGAVVGALLLTPDKRLAGRVTSYRLAFLKADEMSGQPEIAKALLQAAADAAAHEGVARIHAFIRPDDQSKLDLFDSFGPASGVAYVVCLKHGGI